ncbi:MAG: glutathione S-transferase family protein, partial [Alphaproteobacteria bacterium]
MIKVWGRADGSNVIKTMWCIGELGIAYERIDWGGKYGGNDDSAYRAKNPNGRLPTIEEEDGWCVWESGAVIRYLAAKHDMGGLYPADPRARADADRWMDWSSLNLAGFNPVYLDYFFRLPAEERDISKVEAAVNKTTPWLDILDRQLAGRDYICGERLTIGDIPAGALIHRWMTWTPGERPSHPNVEAWYARLCERPA